MHDALLVNTRRAVVAVIAPFVVGLPLGAQSVSDFVPAASTNCAVAAPTAAAGIAATPGGVLMVQPRNEAIGDQDTGCKLLWVVDGDRMLRVATLYFDRGVLKIAIAHDVRDPKGGIEAACDLTAGRSLLPKAGRRADDATCRTMPRDEVYGLRLSTWPRGCLTAPDAAICTQEPR